MREKISKGVFGVISIVALCLGIYALLYTNMTKHGIIMLGTGAVANPKTIDVILRKMKIEGSNYSFGFNMLAIFGGVLVAFVISLFIYSYFQNLIENEDDAMVAFEAILKMIVFLVYLLICLLFKNGNKHLKYIIFGIFYSVCVIISYSSKPFNDVIIKILDEMFHIEVDCTSIRLLIDNFLIPIKESILTYIIFDTVIENTLKKPAKSEEDINTQPESKSEEIHKEDDDKQKDLQEKYNAMEERLTELVKTNTIVTNQVQEMSSEIASVTERINTQQLLAGAIHEEILSAQKQTQNIERKAQDSKAAITGTVHNVKELKKSNEKVSSQTNIADTEIDRIKENAKKMQDITDDISNVAKYSKILAINASIQAAKAGEAGSGFAVVAKGMEEVSKKIKQVSESIDEVASEVTEASNRVKGSLEETKQQTNEQTECLETLNTDVRSIYNNMNDVEKNVAEIKQKGSFTV